MSGFFHAHLTGVSPESRTVNLTSDCPVMSGFFHAPGHSAANFKYIVSDCPVMSGFFHAPVTNTVEVPGPTQIVELIARLCRAFFMHYSIFNHYRSA